MHELRRTEPKEILNITLEPIRLEWGSGPIGVLKNCEFWYTCPSGLGHMAVVAAGQAQPTFLRVFVNYPRFITTRNSILHGSDEKGRFRTETRRKARGALLREPSNAPRGGMPFRGHVSYFLLFLIKDD